MTSGHRLTGALLLVVLAAGCGRSPLESRYQRGVAWFEFRADGTVVHGELGDRARVEFDDGDGSLVLVSGDMRTTGRIVDPSTVEFTPGDSPLATAFAGRWVAGVPATTRASPPKNRSGSPRRYSVGGASPVNPPFSSSDPTDVFVGPGYRRHLRDARRRSRRLVLIQNGTPAGQLNHAVRVEGENLTVTAPNGAVTSYQRVR